MIGRVRQYIKRLLEVPTYTSSLEVQFALINLFISKHSLLHINRDHTLNLFERFLTSGFNDEYPGRLTHSERDRFLQVLGQLRQQSRFDIRNFPFVEDESACRRLGMWLSNVLREDTGTFPVNANTLMPVSIFSPQPDLLPLKKMYQVFDEESGDQKILDLRSYAQMFDFIYWHELLPFAIGPVWVLSELRLYPEDAIIMMRVISDFNHNPSLAMVRVPNRKMVFLRTNLSRRLLLPNMPISLGLAQAMLEKRVKALGWKTQRLWYPRMELNRGVG
ncbi:hypothetical protein [Pontibacter sp. G13]|uniref:hypothetical protein n=1 Tax=Pontibacter sp. G13 TaxID=3074898 RepID=UPI00288AD93C|nr:hypothetical protein [Pontibacter sp. G13]WNJ16084.1 hypothetical protein RJD25_14570 [Pontibacter sp. G13]